MLTNYNGTNISYDEIGNPLNWHNVTSMTWTQGRRLTAYTYVENGETYNVTLAYNSEGIRIYKIAVNANDSSDMKIHSYTVDGSTIIKEHVYVLSQGSISNYTLYYIYDASGDCIGFKLGNGETYLYGKNAQGDVVALFNSATELIARYYYDAWGNCISVTDASGNEITNTTNIALINPIRYRSYHYESDTGFYYLNSRYYDPKVGRFINADVYVSTGQGILSYNMFAYCNNNPVMFVDFSGSCPADFMGPCPGEDRCWYFKNDPQKSLLTPFFIPSTPSTDVYTNALPVPIGKILPCKTPKAFGFIPCGEFALYDNHRSNNCVWHEQAFSVSSTCGDLNLMDGQVGFGSVSVDVYTGGHEFKNVDLSWADLLHGEISATVGVDGIDLGASASIWSPSASFNFGWFSIELGAEVGAVGASLAVTQDKFKLGFSAVCGGYISLSFQ